MVSKASKNSMNWFGVAMVALIAGIAATQLVKVYMDGEAKCLEKRLKIEKMRLQRQKLELKQHNIDRE